MSLLGVEDRKGNMWFLCTSNVSPPFQHKGMWWYKIGVDQGPVVQDDGTITLPIFTEWWPDLHSNTHGTSGWTDKFGNWHSFCKAPPNTTDPVMFQEGGSEPGLLENHDANAIPPVL